jgi:regulator of protease activity HflC (stomatin/prohibitin superfamily)
VLDIYRPRAPGVEPRACFDSRLLGLLAEPGGIASSIADAINYQFGFQVSQTWFYKLLERTFAWLVLAGAAALWLLTCVVVVQPYEHVIIQRWGRQLNAHRPLEPGLHFKRPWPWEVARAYNTGQLHEIHVGFQKPDAQPNYEEAMKNVMLWTDERHLGQEHFDLLICPPRRQAEEGPVLPTSLPGPDQGVAPKESPVNLIRMDVAVQYHIRPDRLDLFTAGMAEPHGAMRDIAWEELVRFCAATTAEDLLAKELGQLGAILRQRIAPRVENLGLEVVYVGVTNVHPEKTVAEAYRNVVKAEQEKVAAIREALVTENERLSKVAGDARSARLLANAVERNRKASELVNDTDKVLSGVDPAVVDEFSARLAEMEPLFRAHVDAAARLEWTQEQKRQVDLEFELGLGQTVDQRDRAGQAVAEAQKSEQAAAAALAAAAADLRRQAAARLGPPPAKALILGFEARVARTYWEEKLEAQFTPARLEGEAATVLAKALAERWAKEMKAAKDLAQMQNERQAYRAAPEVYMTRRLIEVLVEGIKDARKFFLAFAPGDRLVRVRFIAEDDLRLEPTDISPERRK